MKSVDDAKAAATISAALEYVSTDPKIKATRKAVIGWCFGGGWSFKTALGHPELSGAIIYYGQVETDPAKLAPIKAKVMGVFATKDKGIPVATVDAFEAGLAKAGVTAKIYRYDAEHAFANPSNPIYDEASASDAWKHVLEFLTSRGEVARPSCATSSATSSVGPAATRRLRSSARAGAFLPLAPLPGAGAALGSGSSAARPCSAAPGRVANRSFRWSGKGRCPLKKDCSSCL